MKVTPPGGTVYQTSDSLLVINNINQFIIILSGARVFISNNKGSFRLEGFLSNTEFIMHTYKVLFLVDLNSSILFVTSDFSFKNLINIP